MDESAALPKDGTALRPSSLSTQRLYDPWSSNIKGVYRGGYRGFQFSPGENVGTLCYLIYQTFSFFSWGREGSRGFRVQRVSYTLCGAQRVPWDPGTLSDPPLGVCLMRMGKTDSKTTFEGDEKAKISFADKQGRSQEQRCTVRFRFRKGKMVRRGKRREEEREGGGGIYNPK